MAMKSGYVNVVQLDNDKDATLIAGKEGSNYVKDAIEHDAFPCRIVIPKIRKYYHAAKKSLEYSKMGIFNVILKQ